MKELEMSLRHTEGHGELQTSYLFLFRYLLTQYTPQSHFVPLNLDAASSHASLFIFSLYLFLNGIFDGLKKTADLSDFTFF